MQLPIDRFVSKKWSESIRVPVLSLFMPALLQINMSAGRYFGSRENALKMLPFAAGFEAVGEVVAVGEGVKDFAVGAPVATLSYGGFAEFSQVSLRLEGSTQVAVGPGLVPGLSVSDRRPAGSAVSEAEWTSELAWYPWSCRQQSLL